MGLSTKISSSGYLVFAAVALCGMTHPDESFASKAPFVAGGCVALGLLTLKFPFFTTGLGSVIFGPLAFRFIVDEIRSGLFFESPLAFCASGLIVIFIAFAMFFGLFVRIEPHLSRIKSAFRSGD